MNIPIAKDWLEALATELSKPYFTQLLKNVDTAYCTQIVYPKHDEIFAAFTHCPFENIKVVILGQDPYHGAGQAHGLAFSVHDGTPIPPSLTNIFKELSSDLKTPPLTTSNLERWAEQGVLLLNSILTVEAGAAGSHQGLGWETFTDAVITKISEEKTGVVFLLWGTFALSKRTLIDESKHLVLTAPHPSPLSAYRGFFGCKHFSKTNSYLEQHRHSPIIW
jgi:uracil-DNA glycosylase